MLNTLKAQSLRKEPACVRDRRLATWLGHPFAIPDEHHHSHPRYRGLHLVTTEECSLALERSASGIRRFLSAFWGADPDPRRIRRSARAS